MKRNKLKTTLKRGLLGLFFLLFIGVGIFYYFCFDQKGNSQPLSSDTFLNWKMKEADKGTWRKNSLFDLKNEYHDQVHFYNLDQTVDMLINKKMSLARFGDGELNLIDGGKAIFQTFSPTLQERLQEVLSSQDSRIGIGVPISAFAKSKSRFWTKNEKKYIQILQLYINKNQMYFPADITALNVKSEWWFNKMRQVWENRNVHLIHGKGIFDGFQYDIFDNAKSVTHQIAPNRNAFEQYDAILKEALKTNKDDLIIIVLGPTATVLAYDLAKQGYQALDLGHIAKNYDWYMRGKKGENSFYAADGPVEFE